MPSIICWLATGEHLDKYTWVEDIESPPFSMTSQWEAGTPPAIGGPALPKLTRSPSLDGTEGQWEWPGIPGSLADNRRRWHSSEDVLSPTGGSTPQDIRLISPLHSLDSPSTHTPRPRCEHMTLCALQSHATFTTHVGCALPKQQRWTGHAQAYSRQATAIPFRKGQRQCAEARIQRAGSVPNKGLFPKEQQARNAQAARTPDVARRSGSVQPAGGRC